LTVEYKGLRICDVQFYERREGVNFICEKGVKSVDNLHSITLFEKTPILQVFSRAEYNKSEGRIYNQLILFE